MNFQDVAFVIVLAGVLSITCFTWALIILEDENTKESEDE